MPEVSKDSASQIALDFIKKQKSTEKVHVVAIDSKSDCFVVRGTCPINLEGHEWAEKFEVIIDLKGKVKSDFSSLL